MGWNSNLLLNLIYAVILNFDENEYLLGFQY